MKTSVWIWVLLLVSSASLAAFTAGWGFSKQPPAPSPPVPTLSAAPVVKEPAPSAAPVPAAAPLLTPVDLRTLPGRWVGAEFGDAIPLGPLGGSIMPMGVRAVFEEGRAGSKTPWNVTIWAPRQDHMTPETISMGCGFYLGLHAAEDGGGEAFRTAYCRGYGLAAGDSHATTIRLTVRGDGALRVQVGSLLDVVVVRSRARGTR
jgi:hypothetical protein